MWVSKNGIFFWEVESSQCQQQNECEISIKRVKQDNVGITEIQEIDLMARKTSPFNLMEPHKAHTCRESIGPDG